MVRRQLAAASATAAAVVLVALAPAAQGETLGSAARPADAAAVSCYGALGPLVGYQVTESAATWTVPARSALGSWSTNVTAAAGEGSVSLVVLRAAGPDLTIAAVDTAVLPQPAPVGGVATFRPSSPIVLEAGDRLGIAGTAGATCGWQDGEVSSQQSAAVGVAAPGIAPGAIVTESVAPVSSSRLNLAAETWEPTDVRVTAAAGPANVAVGALAQLSGTVTNAGPAATPVTMTDTVPAGLTVTAAVVGAGICGVATQLVTCEIPSLAPGASAPVVVLVTPTAPGVYTNTLTATPALDTAPGDNSATATLTAAAPPLAGGGGGGGGADRVRVVVGPPPRRCVVPTLTRTPLGVARGLLRQFDCRPGMVTQKPSAKIPKGTVISTTPGRGQHQAGRSIRIAVSTGKPPRRRRAASAASAPIDSLRPATKSAVQDIPNQI